MAALNKFLDDNQILPVLARAARVVPTGLSRPIPFGARAGVVPWPNERAPIEKDGVQQEFVVTAEIYSKFWASEETMTLAVEVALKTMAHELYRDALHRVSKIRHAAANMDIHGVMSELDALEKELGMR